MSFVERLSSSRRFDSKCRKPIICDLEECPLLRGLLYCVPISRVSTIGGFTVSIMSIQFSIIASLIMPFLRLQACFDFKLAV